MRSLVFALFTLLLPVLASAQDFSSLEERMNAGEFKAAGLDKLSAAELTVLNEWLRQHGITHRAAAETEAYSVAQPDPNDQRGLPTPPSADGDVVSRIRGPFKGWSGGTRFVLENGQVWEALADSSSLSVDIVDPSVRIKKGLIGTWYLSVEGYNTTAKVRRIQ